MNRIRTTSKIKVNVLDLSGLEKYVFDGMQAKDFKPELDCVRCSESLGYVETPNGIYMLCTEGVGDNYPISKSNPAQFEFIRHWNRDGAKSFEMFPCVGLKLDEREVRSLPVKEVVTLDKFIRSFGSRLECNYSEWQEHLSKQLVNKE